MKLPVDPPVVITQPFGVNWTGIPDFYSRYGLPNHEAIDFGADMGDPILASADGGVTFIGIPGRGGVVSDHAYGKFIKLTHITPNQIYHTQYCHLSGIAPGLTVGDEVRAGQVVGYAGNTGHVITSPGNDGVHLHFMLRKQGTTARGETNYPNDLVDPQPYLK